MVNCHLRKHLHKKTCRNLQIEVPKIKNGVVLYNKENIIFSDKAHEDK